MKQNNDAAARRNNTIARLVDSMRRAQAESSNTMPTRCHVVKVPPRVGIWKGGCQ